MWLLIRIKMHYGWFAVGIGNTCLGVTAVAKYKPAQLEQYFFSARQ